jgi:hypothetical protein
MKSILSNKKQIKNVWGWVYEITFSKTPTSNISDESWTVWNSWMINKSLSMVEDYLPIVNEAQLNSHWDSEMLYNFYRNSIPKKKVRINYIKCTRKINKELISKIGEILGVNLKESEEYLHILNNDSIKILLESIGLNQKEIKKLLK